MAIGDNNNSNLFGTNYNSEEEERKKAELAAQNARMGAGSPTSVGAESVPASAPNPVTFLPYADDVSAPRASALSVFTPGGDLKPGIDVNAITPAPEMISPSAVNTAFNPPEPVLKNALLEMLERADAREAQGLPRQAAPGIIDAPVETPSVGAQDQVETLDPTSDEAILARRAQREAQFSPQGLMGQDATRAALGGMTLNEYLNAPAGTPGVSGLRTDPQGRMITPSAQPPVDSAVPTTVSQPPVDSVVPPAVAQPPVDSAVPPVTAQPPVDALSSFEQASLERQQRIGGTGSFEGDSDARDARLRANERQPGESQTERDTRVAQSRTTGSQAGGMSFDDARRRAKGQLAARGVKNPSVSMVNDLARGIQAGEPERLAELETKKALDAIKLRDEEAKKDFKPQIVEIGDQKLIQLSPNYYQPVRPEPTAEEPFEPRVLEEGGFTYYEVAPNRFERQPSTKVGGATGAVSSAIADAIAAGGGEVTTPAPTSTSPAPVRINSQAEYDALPVGTLYIDSQGTETVKK